MPHKKKEGIRTEADRSRARVSPIRSGIGTLLAIVGQFCLGNSGPRSHNHSPPRDSEEVKFLWRETSGSDRPVKAPKCVIIGESTLLCFRHRLKGRGLYIPVSLSSVLQAYLCTCRSVLSLPRSVGYLVTCDPTLPQLSSLSLTPRAPPTSLPPLSPVREYQCARKAQQSRDSSVSCAYLHCPIPVRALSVSLYGLL